MYKEKDIIKFKSLEEIMNNYCEIENSKIGANSTIYKFSENKVMKILKNPPQSSHINILQYFFKEYKNQLFLKPIKYVIVNNILYGYILKLSNGTMLENLDDEIFLVDFFNSFINIEKNIEIISKKGIYMDDISKRNILYDKFTKTLDFIDYDNYKFMEMDKRMLYRRNLSEILQTIIFSFISEYKTNSVGDFTKDIISKGYTITNSLYYIKKYVESISKKQLKTVYDLKEQSHILIKIK